MRAVPCVAMDETPAQKVDGPVGEAAEKAQEQPKNSRSGWIWATVVVLALAGVCGFVSIKANSGSTPAPERALTCGEWSAEGEANKTIQAREMLTTLRQKDGLGAPETATAQRFAVGLTGLCESSADSAGLAQLAAGLYLTQRGTSG